MNSPENNSNSRRPLPPGARPGPPGSNPASHEALDDIPVAKPIRHVTPTTPSEPTAFSPTAQTSTSPAVSHEVDINVGEAPNHVHSDVNVVLTGAEHQSPVAQDAVEEMVESAKYSAPYWLMSLLVHTLILIVLGLILLPAFQSYQILVEAIFAD